MRLKIAKKQRGQRITALLMATLLCAPLAACTASGSGADMTTVMPSGEFVRDGITGDSIAGSSAQSEMDGSLSAATIASTEGRSIISNGSISLEVRETQAAASEVLEITEALGGHIESQSIGGVNSEYAQLTLRVPADRFDDAFAQLREVGEVQNEDRSASDVTMQHVDLKARVGALEASIERLTELMAGAATTSELLEAEAALSQRQAELDGLRAQLQQLEGQINEATIWVSLGVKSAPLPGGPSNFWEGLVSGAKALVAFAAGAIVVLGMALPWLAVFGVLAAAVVLLVRGIRRRRPAADRSAASTAPGDADSNGTDARP